MICSSKPVARIRPDCQRIATSSRESDADLWAWLRQCRPEDHDKDNYSNNDDIQIRRTEDLKNKTNKIIVHRACWNSSSISHPMQTPALPSSCTTERWPEFIFTQRSCTTIWISSRKTIKSRRRKTWTHSFSDCAYPTGKNRASLDCAARIAAPQTWSICQETRNHTEQLKHAARHQKQSVGDNSNDAFHTYCRDCKVHASQSIRAGLQRSWRPRPPCLPKA